MYKKEVIDGSAQYRDLYGLETAITDVVWSIETIRDGKKPEYPRRVAIRALKITQIALQKIQEELHMQVWLRFKIEHIADTQTDTQGVKKGTRQVVLANCASESVPANTVTIAVDINGPSEDFIFPHIFDGRIGQEIEVRFTAGDMLEDG